MKNYEVTIDMTWSQQIKVKAKTKAESGLRSGNLDMAEEKNRIEVDRVSDFLFAPTCSAVDNLMRENVCGEVFRTDDIMYDNLWHYNLMIDSIDIEMEGSFIFVTIHRYENVSDSIALRDIIEGILNGAEELGVKVFMPLHPRTRARLEVIAYDLLISPYLITSEPISYLKTLAMLSKCEFVITDSGGIQRESNFFLKPCIVTRNETEWIEQVESGGSVLCGSDKDKIQNEMIRPSNWWLQTNQW